MCTGRQGLHDPSGAHPLDLRTEFRASASVDEVAEGVARARFPVRADQELRRLRTTGVFQQGFLPLLADLHRPRTCCLDDDLDALGVDLDRGSLKVGNLTSCEAGTESLRIFRGTKRGPESCNPCIS